jgi:glycogen operon protein
VWSSAEHVELCLFEPDGTERRHALARGEHGVFHEHVHGVGPGQPYGLRAYGPYAP